MLISMISHVVLVLKNMVGYAIGCYLAFIKNNSVATLQINTYCIIMKNMIVDIFSFNIFAWVQV